MSVCLVSSPERNYHYQLCPNAAACSDPLQMFLFMTGASVVGEVDTQTSREMGGNTGGSLSLLPLSVFLA